MATLSGACAAPYKKTVAPRANLDTTIVTVSYSAPPTVPQITPGHYESLVAALEAVMATRTPIIALGEIHKFDNTSLPSTAELVAGELFPIMKKHGRRTLATELLPFGLQNNQAVAEFNRTRTVQPGSLLDHWLNEVMLPDYCGTLGMLNAAADNGITLYGTNISTPEEYLALRMAGREDELSMTVNRNTLTVISALRDQDSTSLITTYNGARHNNVIPLTGEEAHSFGQLFPADRYLEIDILLAELLPTVPGKYLTEEIRGSIPATGITLLRQENRVTIILPKSDQPVSPRPASSLPVCR
ncbi:hypothetical protein A2346_01265 [candidate division WOR-1 bacterium RIFOXYB12_FULL_52_16]|nr:MAG: hypothetical protein A2346_01265 [candidate division WOR-1 bacterium RIFOXYB12_FULL_52_16]